MLERGIRDAALGPLWDPVAARIAFDAGPGATLNLRIGGKIGPLSGDPVDVSCTVKAVKADLIMTGLAQAPMPMGDTALVEAEGIDIVLTSNRNQAMNIDLFTQLGCDPATRRIVVVKSAQHFHASFSTIARHIIYVGGPGVATPAWWTLLSQHHQTEVAPGPLGPSRPPANPALPKENDMKKRFLTPLAMVLALACAGVSHAADTKTLRMVPYTDLKILDPMFTTSYITRNFGYMVYDTLFAMNTKGEPQPEMVDTWKTSDDGKEWTFTLRPGLKFSDGQAVTAADCVASLKRWQARDNIGHALTEAGGQWSAVDDKTFKLTLAKPFGLVLDGLAKVSSYPAFIMPERLASQPTTKPLTEVVGSGPYLFKKDEWVPGNKVVFERNPDYAGRKEAPDGLAGNKTSQVDRVEWVILPDANSAIASLKSGEIDMIEQVPPDFIAGLRDDKNLTTGQLTQQQVYMVMNHAFPPFDNPKARQAVAHAIDQNDVTSAMGYPDDLRKKYCATFFICGGPNETDAGSEPFHKPNLELAKKLLAESGYKGQKIAVLLPTDVGYLNAATLVAAQALQNIGMNVDLQSMDFSTATARRAKKVPPDQGGWNIYVTSAAQFNVDSPINSTYLGASCGNSLPGWPCDKKLDELRNAWISATDPAERKKLLDEFQVEAYQTLPNLPIGQYSTVFATQKSITHTDKLWGLPNVWVLGK